MGFLRRLFGTTKKQNQSSKEKRRWSFVRSSNTDSPNSSSLFSSNNKYTTTATTTTSLTTSSPYEDGLDANKHAIAVAAATAAVAEAALAAAQAAAEVVRLTSGGGGGGAVRCSNGGSGHRWRLAHETTAAIVIQSAFRGYLARRALKALKALVKLQAHVRGHIVRKQTADMLRRMQTLVRVQTRARATRSHVSKSFHSVSQLEISQNDGCGSNSNFRDVIHPKKTQKGSNWLNRWMEDSVWNNKREPSMRLRHADDPRNDKILEVDTWKPHLNPQHNNRSFRTPHHVFVSDYSQSPMSITSSPSKKSRNLIPVPSEVSSVSSPKVSMRKEESASRTTQNSPRVMSRPGSSHARRGPFTPTGSECSWGYFGGYAGHPNYMANTESSKAKVRSQSAPRQRLELEGYGSNRGTLQGFLDTSVNSSGKGYGGHYGNYGYPVSSYLDRLGSSNVRR